ncbi:MAG: hypothetical protein OJF48_003662 [Afipia sp.]|jgi:hypothetical protein|nr:MAG: hypothetical protein OJF48_003662 [Afipia sp.]
MKHSVFAAASGRDYSGVFLGAVLLGIVAVVVGLALVVA